MNFGGEPGFYRLRTVPAVHDIKAITALEGSAGEIRNCALGMPGPWEHSGICAFRLARPNVTYRGAKRRKPHHPKAGSSGTCWMTNIPYLFLFGEIIFEKD